LALPVSGAFQHHFPGSHYFISQQYHQSQQTQTYCKMKPTIAALFGVIAMACADHSSML
jgi:hypothetical protein